MVEPAHPDVTGLPPLIPRVLLFGNPQRWHPTLAPDGRTVAWLAPDAHAVRQVWVRTRGTNDDRCVTADRHRGISFYGWAWDSTTIIYVQDSDGDENYHLFAVDLESGNVRDLTPWQGVRCEFVAGHPQHPDEVLVALNVRDRSKMDVWRVNLRTGSATFDAQNPGDVASWLADDDFVVRAATAITAKGAYEVRVRDNGTSSWRAISSPHASDEVSALGFSKDGSELFLKSSIGSETVRVFVKNLTTSTEREIAGLAELDAEDVMFHPIRRIVEAVAFEPDRRSWQIVDPGVAGDFDSLAKVCDGHFSILSRDQEDNTWIAAYGGDRLPPRYYFWTRRARQAEFLFSSQPKLDDYQFSATRAVSYHARDGMEIHAYLTTPDGADVGRLPMVLFVHGGPWARDYWATIRGYSFSPIVAMRFYSPTIEARPAMERNTFTPEICSGAAQCRTTSPMP
jgi:dipeptidyl aminopeptidase/acylaminoacyl peptidase